MDPDSIAPMIVAVTLILTTGGVVLLRPLAKRLGAFLDQATQEKLRGSNPRQAQTEERVLQLLEAMDARMGRLEERVNFTEAVLLSRPRGEAPTLPPEVRG